MAFHIPFNQRSSGRKQQIPGPIYIGFDLPTSPRRPTFNWWGFNGMWMSFFSLLTAGFVSPLTLLISLIGLRRPGKIMATVGTLVSLGGTTLATLIGMHGYDRWQNHLQQQEMAIIEQENRANIAQTESVIALAVAEIQEYQSGNKGLFPGDIEANMLVIKHLDPWGESLRFDLEEDHANIRSAGRDKKFGTADDVLSRVEGTPESSSPNQLPVIPSPVPKLAPKSSLKLAPQ